MASLLDDLKREIAGAAKPLIVCGAGVSKAANPKAPDWRALIESGIDRVVAFGLADEEWGARQRQAEWLRGLLGELKAERTEILDALRELAQAGCLISTTNYDGMLGDELDLPVIRWADHAKVLQYLNGQRKGSCTCTGIGTSRKA